MCLSILLNIIFNPNMKNIRRSDFGFSIQRNDYFNKGMTILLLECVCGFRDFSHQFCPNGKVSNHLFLKVVNGVSYGT